VVSLVDRVQDVVISHLVGVVRQGDGVFQLQQDRLHEHQRGREEVDQMAPEVLSVVEEQFHSVWWQGEEGWGGDRSVSEW